MERHSQGSADIKKALQETVPLDDGRRGYVLSELPPIGLLSRWHCHVCSRTISTERSLLMHLTHPVHTSNLRLGNHPAKEFKRFYDHRSGSSKSALWELSKTDVSPGEPVPPGMEDVVRSDCQIQAAFDTFTEPLIGLEYIVELVSSDETTEPRYICLLCEKRGDPRSVMVHVTSQNHNLKYICCFFRSAGNILNLTQRTPGNRKAIAIAARKVAAEIEKHYGRLKPTSAVAETFAQKKNEILKQIDENKHFRETPSTTFLELVTPEKLEEYRQEAPQGISAMVKVNQPKNTNGEKVAPRKELEEPRFEERLVKPKKTEPPKAPPKVPQRPVVKCSPSMNPAPGVEKKYSFKIGQPEKSTGKPLVVQNSNPEVDKIDDDDDDVIIIDDTKDDPGSISTISSDSSPGGSPRRSRDVKRRYSRGRSPDRRRYSPYRRRRTRSRSHDRRPSRRESPPYYRIEEKMRRERRLNQVVDARRRDRDRDYDSRRRSVDRRHRDYSSERRKRSSTRERRSKSSREPERMRSSEKMSPADKLASEMKNLKTEFENKLKYFEARPEKHPMYNEEWKLFWNKRYKEVQQSGKDPNSYDFKPEWIIYWGKRMKELNEEELKRRILELKAELAVEKKPVEDPNSGLQDIVSSEEEADAEWDRDVTVEDIRNTWKGLTGTELSAPARKRSPSPYSYKPVKRQNFDPSPPVLHTLRMLSVMEEQLGSLGPKSLELLSKALVAERIKTGHSLSLLDDLENRMFFDTVKEKIRGQLQAGIVEKNLVSSCRSTVNAIEKLLAQYIAVPMALAPVPKPVLKPLLPPVQVPGIGMIDKLAVAKQIAGALVAQNKTDVSQEELEDLINAVVGIAKASNASVTQNTSSAAFFSQLNMKTSTATSHINDILANMIKGVTGEEVEAPKPPEPVPPVVKPVEEKDDGLREKLMKFSVLPREEQQKLIAMLKELEKTDPKRVETLRNYVSLGINSKPVEPIQETGRKSPFTSRAIDSYDSMKDSEVRQKSSRVDISDDDDDDYDFEDVYKAASAKVRVDSEAKSESRSSFNEDSSTRFSGKIEPVPSVSSTTTDKSDPSLFSKLLASVSRLYPNEGATKPQQNYPVNEPSQTLDFRSQDVGRSQTNEWNRAYPEPKPIPPPQSNYDSRLPSSNFNSYSTSNYDTYNSYEPTGYSQTSNYYYDDNAGYNAEDQRNKAVPSNSQSFSQGSQNHPQSSQEFSQSRLNSYSSYYAHKY